MLQDRWAKQWKDEGIMPVPEGFSATLMFSSAFFNTVILKNGLSKSGWAVEDVSPKDQAYSKIECRHTGTFNVPGYDDMLVQLDSPGGTTFRIDGAQIPLSNYPLALTISQDSEFQTPTIHGFWSITHDLRWNETTRSNTLKKWDNGTLAGQWCLCDQGDSSRRPLRLKETEMTLTDEALNLDIKPDIKEIVCFDAPKEIRVTRELWRKGMEVLDTTVPDVKISPFGFGFLRMTNLLFPGGNAIEIDRNIGVRAPKDIILFGDVMKD